MGTGSRYLQDPSIPIQGVRKAIDFPMSQDGMDDITSFLGVQLLVSIGISIPEVSLFKPELRKGRMLKSTMPPARCGSLTLPSRVDWGLLGALNGGDVEKKHSMLGSRSERHEPPQKKTGTVFI